MAGAIAAGRCWASLNGWISGRSGPHAGHQLCDLILALLTSPRDCSPVADRSKRHSWRRLSGSSWPRCRFWPMACRRASYFANIALATAWFGSTRYISLATAAFVGRLTVAVRM
jgi:hypothetical protein